MLRNDLPEVAVVEGSHGGYPESFGDCDDRCVSRSEREAAVLNHQFRHPPEVRRGQWFDLKFFCRQGSQELCLSLWSMLGEHVADLGHDGRWNDQWAGFVDERCRTGLVLAVLAVRDRQQRPGIANDHAPPPSSRRRTSCAVVAKSGAASTVPLKDRRRAGVVGCCSVGRPWLATKRSTTGRRSLCSSSVNSRTSAGKSMSSNAAVMMKDYRSSTWCACSLS